MKPMTRKEALAYARQLWGENAYVERRDRNAYKGIAYPTSVDELIVLRASLELTRKNRPLRPDLQAWDGNDTVESYRRYVNQFNKAFAEWREREQALESIVLTGTSHCVGTTGTAGPFNTRHVRGDGFSWEQAFAKATEPYNKMPRGIQGK